MDKIANTPRYGSRFRIATLILFGLLICFQIFKVFNTALLVDDAIFAGVARNIADGIGYTINIYGEYHPFHPGISSGPVIILPAAFMVWLFGHGFWVPALASVIIINMLLITLFFSARRIIKSPATCWLAAGIFLFSALIFNNINSIYPDQKLFLWHGLVGDVPSGLLIIIAALYVAGRHSDKRYVFFAGIIASLGMLCKLQAVVGAGALGAYLVINQLHASGINRENLWRSLVLGCTYSIGILVPLAMFELYKLISMGGIHAYITTLEQLADVVYTLHAYDANNRMLFLAYKILETSKIILAYDVIEDSGHVISNIAYLVIGTICLVALIARILRYLLSPTSALSPLEQTCRILLWCCLAHLFWWLVLSQFTLVRYSTQAVLYGCAALALYIAHISLGSFTKAVKISAALIIALIVARYDAVFFMINDGPKHHVLIDDQLKAAKHLEDIQKKSPNNVIFSCATVMDMQYLMSTKSDVLPCDYMFKPEYINKPKTLLTYYRDDHDGKNVFFPPGSFLLIERDIPKEVRALCPKDDIYAGRKYFIASCKG